MINIEGRYFDIKNFHDTIYCQMKYRDISKILKYCPALLVSAYFGYRSVLIIDAVKI